MLLSHQVWLNRPRAAGEWRYRGNMSLRPAVWSWIPVRRAN